ncbi:MAG TPA: LodA/GoxA family CTQ-dependent oxidase [Thermoanaerobaculia bacterium]|nr:LodA/GoxA family CTQ-dependent oxidase [Thermoanaerobaculia bacterium]
MPSKYKIHPSIGLARLGNSEEFYIGPESLSALPIQCSAEGDAAVDANGNEQPVAKFRDNQGRVKRQAARFRIFAYDDTHPDGVEVQVRDVNKGIKGTIINGVSSSGELVDIRWVVWMGNKKAAWYEFQELSGEHGYSANHPLRNANISNRGALVIDPGPTFVSGQHASAEIARGRNPNFTQSFPPPLTPASIDSLGSVRTDAQNRLLVVGAYGNSGSLNSGLGEPQITSFVNNDGWFDDIADGPVTAVLSYYAEDDQTVERIAVSDPAWCIVGYPRWAPEIPDLVTMDDLLYDLNIREFAYRPLMYGTPPFAPLAIDYDLLGIDDATDQKLAKWRRTAKIWNDDYYPYWDTEIYPILSRPYLYQQFTTVLIQDDPHETAPGGNFDMSVINTPPGKPNDPDNDRGWYPRNFILSVLRAPGQENVYSVDVAMKRGMQPIQQPLMPLLNGDNPITNTLVSKFFTLTATQLFILRQWAAGKFIAGNQPTDDPAKVIGPPPASKGVQLDRSVVANALGGSFCPGAETTWFIRNPQIFSKPYRIRQKQWAVNIGDTRQAVQWYDDQGLDSSTSEDLAAGLEAGDMTKRNGVPWQSDFNECSTQDIDVRYSAFNSTEEKPLLVRQVIWWPAHRPLQVTDPKAGTVQWAKGVPQTYAGDLKMVTAWKSLGFLRNTSPQPVTQPNFVQVERNDKEL